MRKALYIAGGLLIMLVVSVGAAVSLGSEVALGEVYGVLWHHLTPNSTSVPDVTADRIVQITESCHAVGPPADTEKHLFFRGQLQEIPERLHHFFLVFRKHAVHFRKESPGSWA